MYGFSVKQKFLLYHRALCKFIELESMRRKTKRKGQGRNRGWMQRGETEMAEPERGDYRERHTQEGKEDRDREMATQEKRDRHGNREVGGERNREREAHRLRSNKEGRGLEGRGGEKSRREGKQEGSRRS